MKKKKEGFGCYTYALLGFELSSVQTKIFNFLGNLLDKRLMLHNLKEEIKGSSEKEKKSELLNLNQKIMLEELKKINWEIGEINRNVLVPLNIPKTLPLLNVSLILEVIKKRFSYYQPNKDSIESHNENIRLKIMNRFNPILQELKNILGYLKEKETFEEMQELDSEYKKNILEAINIFSIGYGKTAVLCVGRTIEKAINNYLRILKNSKKISPKKYLELINGKEDKEPKYSIKIGFIHGDKYLNEEEFLKLKAYSFERNKGGHPNLGEINIQRARTLISQGIWIIIDLQKKIKKIEKKLNSQKTIH